MNNEICKHDCPHCDVIDIFDHYTDDGVNNPNDVFNIMMAGALEIANSLDVDIRRHLYVSIYKLQIEVANSIALEGAKDTGVRH